MAREDMSSSWTTTDRDVETDTRWAHKGIGGLWWLGLLLVPLLLAALLTAIKGGDIESDLMGDAEAALAAGGVTGANVEVDGRDVTLGLPGTLPSGIDAAGAEALVAKVDGVRSVSLADGSGADGSAGAAGDGEKGDEGGTGDEGDGSGDAAASGDADGDADGSGTEGDADQGGTAAASCAEPQSKVDEILGENAVAFGEASAVLRGAEKRQVVRVARLLAGCDASVAVTGHTDDRARPTSPLSQGRADVVATVLRNAGVEVTSAEGVGAKDPIGDNTTQEGRDLNRFAAIVVE